MYLEFSRPWSLGASLSGLSALLFSALQWNWLVHLRNSTGVPQSALACIASASARVQLLYASEYHLAPAAFLRGQTRLTFASLFSVQCTQFTDISTRLRNEKESKPWSLHWNDKTVKHITRHLGCILTVLMMMINEYTDEFAVETILLGVG